MLTADDYKNILALINRTTLQGTEAETIATLKARLVQAYNFSTQTETGTADQVPED